MEKSSKLKNSIVTQAQKKNTRNLEPKKPSNSEIKPRIQRLCTLSGIPAKNPIPHGPGHAVTLPLEAPKINVAYSPRSVTDRKGSWESILAAQTKSKTKTPKATVPTLLLSSSTAPSPVTNPYNHRTHHRDTPHYHEETIPNSINFHSFDPIRTLQFLTLELKSRIKLHLPDEMNLHRIVAEIQQTIKRLSTVSTSTAIIETTSSAGGDERRIIREDYQSFSGGDSMSGHFARAVNNRPKYKNQVVQTENPEPFPITPPLPPTLTLPLKPTILVSRADNTDSSQSLKKVAQENKELEVSNIKLQREVSKYHDQLEQLRKRQHKLEGSLKSRDKQINQLQKELHEIEMLMKEQINLMNKDNIFIDLKSGGDSEHKKSNYEKNQKLLNNLSTSTSITNLQISTRSPPEKEVHKTPSKHNYKTNLEYEKLFTKPQLKSPSTLTTLMPPRVSLSTENYKVTKEKSRWYSDSISNKGGYYHEDSGDNDDDIIRSKKKLAAAALHHDESNNLKEININMDEIKAIFNDVKLPSPPRKFRPELPSFM